MASTGTRRPLPEECLSRTELAALQVRRLGPLLDLAWARCPLYRRKWAAAGLADPGAVRTPADLARLPFTTRAELNAAQAAHPPAGDLPTVPPDQFVAVHQTAGISAPPLLWYDTAASWRWVQDGWEYVLRSAGIAAPGARAFFAFDFAPVLWFWAGFELAQRRGVLTLPGGGMSPLQRVEAIFQLGAELLVTTPDHALELARVAADHGYPPARSPLRAVIYAGRPEGGAAIAAAWGAEAFAVTWLTEAGITGYECPAHPGGVHLLESQVICEVVDPGTGAPAAAGELVVTPLGRTGMPVIRYRTGDLVRMEAAPCPCGRTFARLAGGILGRAGEGGAG